MGMVKNNINSTTLIRGIYRALLNTGRTYAAFESRHMMLLEQLKDRGDILDPMSGYGGLMKYCSESEYSLASYNIECNPPSYYWQYLMHPENNELFRKLCADILKASDRWPRPRVNIAASDDWFPEDSLCLFESLWLLTWKYANKLSNKKANDITIAFLLPFVGRLSSCIQGNVVTHVKKGGLCVYVGWREDFKRYISKLICIFNENNKKCKGKKHTIRLGDAASIKIANKRFSAMLTSPPYPNSRDYFKMFAPENSFLQWLFENGYIPNITPQLRLIGSSNVSEKDRFTKHTPDEIKSTQAKEFLSFIANYSETKRAKKDNEVYYLPYYCNYFYGLEKVYENISQYLASNFIGYIISVNNTARKRIIPVSDFIQETWVRLGFQVKIEAIKELAHVGGINPRVKGLSARHVEYTIKVYR